MAARPLDNLPLNAIINANNGTQLSRFSAAESLNMSRINVSWKKDSVKMQDPFLLEMLLRYPSNNGFRGLFYWDFYCDS